MADGGKVETSLGVQPPVKSSARRKWLVAGAGAGIVAIVAGVALLVLGQGRERTDNAYVRADISVLSAEVQGYVRKVLVTDNQHVKSGEALVQIDPSDYAAHVQRAEASLAHARAQLASGYAEQAHEAADYDRYRNLAHSGLYSQSALDALRASTLQAGAATRESSADIDAAKADLENARLDLSRTTIRAPVDGVIGNRVVMPGQMVRPGVQLLSVVPLSQVYVVANFKETQLTHMRAGQPALIRVDAYPGLKLTGIVDSLAPASGSQFSILPQDTATGNFTKITQRVPVKIRLNLTPQAQGLLRPGLSVEVTVDTRRKAG